MTDEFCFELAASLAVMLMEMKAELDDFAEMTHLEPEIELEGVHLNSNSVSEMFRISFPHNARL